MLHETLAFNLMSPYGTQVRVYIHVLSESLFNFQCLLGHNPT